MSSICQNLSTGSDSAVNNAVVRDVLVACNMRAKTIRANTVIANNLLGLSDDGSVLHEVLLARRIVSCKITECQ